MPDRIRTIVLAVVGILVIAGLAHGRGATKRSAATGYREVGLVSGTERAATFTFAPDVSAYDRQAILQAVAGARPEARRLVGVVDGLVTVEVGAPPVEHAVGLTSSDGNRYRVVLNLGEAVRASGERGLARLVLHELGHVVRFALVPDDLRDRMDAEVPRGIGCRDGVTGACTSPDEIWAESFAKWASGDIGINLNLGYAIPPPDDLEHWGAPLAALER